MLYLLGWAQVAGDATESNAALEVVRFQSLSVLGFEVVADWLKHAFVAKFNRVDASAYDAYAESVARDVVTGRRGGDAGFALDHTQAVTRRLSFPLLPLACVAVRYAALSLGWLRLSAGVISVVGGGTSLAGLPVTGPAQAAHLHMSGGRRGRALPRRGGDAGAVEVAAARGAVASRHLPALRKATPSRSQTLVPAGV